MAQNLNVVDKFCYLGDMLSAGGGAEEAAKLESGQHGVNSMSWHQF